MSDPPQARPVVLVVEDNRELRATIASVLEDAGYDVREAADGAVALDEAQRCHPRVIVLDLAMPRVDGEEFAEAYRQLPDGPDEKAPIVVVSVVANGAETSARIRADRYLSKPFELDDLVTAVERALARREE